MSILNKKNIASKRGLGLRLIGVDIGSGFYGLPNIDRKLEIKSIFEDYHYRYQQVFRAIILKIVILAIALITIMMIH